MSEIKNLPGKLDIYQYGNDDFSEPFEFYTQASRNAPLVETDLTGYTARMQIKRRGSNTALISLSTGSGIVATNDYTFTVTISKDDLAGNLEPGTYVYDFELTSAGDITRTLVAGKFVYQPDITN